MAGHPPPGDGPPPSSRHAAPTGHAGQEDSVGPPHPHTRAHSTWVAHPNSPTSGRAVGGGTGPDLRRPSQWWKAPPRGRPSATPTAGNTGPQGSTLWGWYGVPTPAPTAPGTHGSQNPGCPLQRMGGRERDSARHQTPLTTVAGQPPRGRPPGSPLHAAPTGHAGQGDSVGPRHPHTRAHSTWVADPDSPPSGRAVGGGTAPDLRRPSQWWKTPPPGTPIFQPHSEQCRPARAHAVGPVLVPHARTDRTRDKRVAEPWLPAPENGRLGEGQRLTPDAPHNGGRPPPLETPPHHPCRTQPPQGMQAKGASVGPPHPRTRAHSTWVGDPDSPPSGRVVGGGTAPDLRRPSQWWKAPPPGTPLRHPHSEQRRPARAHAVGPVLGPHARTDRTRDTRVAEPRLPAPEDGRPGEGQRLTPDAPHNGGRPAPPGTAPHQPRGTQPPRGMQAKGDSVGPPQPHTRAHGTWVADPNSPPAGRAVGGGTVPDLRRPSQWWKAPPPRDALPSPPQRATPARKGARCGAGAGSPRPHRAHPEHTGRGTLAAHSRGRAAGGGTAPDTRRPSQRWRATPPGDGPPPPPREAAHTGHAGPGDSVGPPHPHTRAHSTLVADPNSPPSGRAVGGGTAPDLGRPSQWWKTPPPGTPFRHPHSEQRLPARAHAVGPVLGLHARTDRTGDARVAEPWLPAPEGRAAGGGTAPDTDAPHNSGGPPPPGTAPHHPRGRQPPRGMQAKGTVLGPHTHTPPPTARGWRTPTARSVGGQLGEGQRLTSDAPHNGGRHPPQGRPYATPTASNAGPQGRTLWGLCWVPTPAPTAPGTHGSRNPRRPLQRTGGQGRDSA